MAYRNKLLQPYTWKGKRITEYCARASFEPPTLVSSDCVTLIVPQQLDAKGRNH